MSIVLIDSTSDSLTVSWTDSNSGESIQNIKNRDNHPEKYYVLQYRMATQSVHEYTTLSDSLRMTQARKKNLIDPNRNGFIFRVGSRTSNKPIATPDTTDQQDQQYDNVVQWITHTEPFHLLTREQEIHRMDAPKVRFGGSNASLLISWVVPSADSTNDSNSITYEIQMRENLGGIPWTTISAAFHGTEVRKNNLVSNHGYQFRVRPNSTPSHDYYYSSPSEPVVALSYSNSGIKHLFQSLQGNVLLSNRQLSSKNIPQASDLSSFSKVPVADLLGGKEFILFYVSAHWCGPCRKYTPNLIKWYNQQQLSSSKAVANYSPIEIVFISCDHDINSFISYYQTMPWTAIPYDDEGTREHFMSLLRVSGIPRLVVYDSQKGTIVDDNAVGKPLDLSRWRKK